MPHSRSVAWVAYATLLAFIAPALSSAFAAERYWPPIVDPATGVHHPGRWVWGDLVTSDVGTAAKFYGDVFGWTFETYGSDDDFDTYTLALSDGLPIGGMVFDKRALNAGVPAARWIGFMSVTDVRRAAQAVEQQGGKVVLAPTVLGERGETAVFRDPEGALFAVVRASSGDPADYVGDENEWMWIDLWADDVARETEFYRTIAGYEVLPFEGTERRSGVYLVSGGYARAGIMRKLHSRATTTWIPYIRVGDAGVTAEKARAAGGKVLIEPVQLPRSTVAIISDPTGAPVGIAELHKAGEQP